MTFPGQAQTPPLLTAIENRLYDEWGDPLSRENGGDLIQVLLVNGSVFPPDSNGQPHPDNPVLFTSSIGHGTIKHHSTEGKSVFGIVPRPSQGVEMVVRVFNAPTLEEATFCMDSQVFASPDNAIQKMIPEFGELIPVDSGDDDNDGLNNAWEQSMGSDRKNPDTDGDGVSDGAEFRAGTDMLNPNSFLHVMNMHRVDSNDMIVIWDAVPGKRYQLQFTYDNDLTLGHDAFVDVNGRVLSTGWEASTVVEDGQLYPKGIFRILLVE